MYEDLADAVETMRENGFIHSFELKDGFIVCKDIGETYNPEEVTILESYRHERMTDPGTDETVFALESSSGIKGILVAAYGMYVEHDKGELISKLLSSQEKIQ